MDEGIAEILRAAQVAQGPALADLVAAHEAACLAELQAILRRHQCVLRGAPAPVGSGDVWTIRWGVAYAPCEGE